MLFCLYRFAEPMFSVCTVILYSLYTEEKNSNLLESHLRLVSGFWLGIPHPMKKVSSPVNAGNRSYGLICP